MQVVILCGGRGTRAYPLTEYVPKPMLPIGGRPILWHLMKLFADQGHKEFVLSVGYRQDVIRDYHREMDPDWHVEIIDTGEDAETGDRIHRCRHLLGETFFATYGDGLANISLDALIAFHAGHPGVATVTSVPLTSQYGTLEMDHRGRVRAFREKPMLRDVWINAGFLIMDRTVFDHWEGRNLEREVMPGLTEHGLLYAYRHDGFFKPLDSYKDQQELDTMWQSGRAPWLRPTGA